MSLSPLDIRDNIYVFAGDGSSRRFDEDEDSLWSEPGTRRPNVDTGEAFMFVFIAITNIFRRTHSQLNFFLLLLLFPGPADGEWPQIGQAEIWLQTVPGLAGGGWRYDNNILSSRKYFQMQSMCRCSGSPASTLSIRTNGPEASPRRSSVSDEVESLSRSASDSSVNHHKNGSLVTSIISQGWVNY